MKINRQIRFFGPLLAMGIIATLVSIGVVQAYENSINFESDWVGVRANGFASVDSSHVTFTDSQGASLFLGNFGVQSDGRWRLKMILTTAP